VFAYVSMFTKTHIYTHTLSFKPSIKQMLEDRNTKKAARKRDEEVTNSLSFVCVCLRERITSSSKVCVRERGQLLKDASKYV